MEGEKVGKDESVPTLSRIVPRVLSFQWEDWDIAVFCLDSFLHLSFPQTL